MFSLTILKQAVKFLFYGIRLVLTPDFRLIFLTRLLSYKHVFPVIRILLWLYSSALKESRKKIRSVNFGGLPRGSLPGIKYGSVSRSVSSYRIRFCRVTHKALFPRSKWRIKWQTLGITELREPLCSPAPSCLSIRFAQAWNQVSALSFLSGPSWDCWILSVHGSRLTCHRLRPFKPVRKLLVDSNLRFALS